MSRLSSALLCLGLASLTLPMLPSKSAAAQDNLQEAKSLYLKGQQLYKSGKPMDAAASFEASYKLSSRPEMLYYIGLAYEKGGALLRAQSAYQKYLDALPDAKNADKVLDTVIALQENISTEMARVDVTQNVSDGDLFVDQEATPRCTEACLIALKPGTHTLTLKDKSGKTLDTQELKVSAGDQKKLAIGKTGPVQGNLWVRGVKDSTLRLQLDGKPYPIPASGQLTLQSKRYQANLTKSGKTIWSGSIRVPEKDTTQLLVAQAADGSSSSSSSTSLLQVASWALVGVGTGLLVGGAVLGSQSTTTFDTLEAQRSRGIASDPALVAQGEDQQSLANILMITGGVSLLGGGGLLVWDLLSDDPGPAPTASTPPATTVATSAE